MCSKSSGGIATVLATCLLSIGWALNVAALSTCRLVATDGFRDTENDNGLVTGLGLYTFEGSDGWGQSYCYIFEYTTLTSNFSYWVDTRMNAARWVWLHVRVVVQLVDGLTLYVCE